MTQPPSFQPPARRPRRRQQGATPSVADSPTSRPPVRNGTPRAEATPERAHVPWHNNSAIPDAHEARRKPAGSPTRKSVFTNAREQQSQSDTGAPQARPTAARTSAFPRREAGKSNSYQAQGRPRAYAPRQRIESERSELRSSTPPAYAPHRRQAQPADSARAAQPRTYAPVHRSFPTRTAFNTPAPEAAKPQPKKRSRKGIIAFAIIAIVFAALIAWPLGLMMWANGKLQRVEALSNKPAGQGTTYLIAGSDERSNGKDGGITGGPHDSQRADTIILVHWAPNGQKSMVSIPRDTAVELPGVGLGKINSAFSSGGPRGLVKAVENFTGLKVDHYFQISMGGVTEMVNAVGGINLCYDRDVNDPRSEMVWKAGCHDADGKQALAFARMRYSDPLGDIGRTNRQRQVVSKLVEKATSFPGVLSPSRQIGLIDGATASLRVDEQASILDLAWAGLAFKGASQAKLNGVPPIASMSYWKGVQGSKVLITPEAARGFFTKMENGTLTPADYYQNK